MGVLVYLLLVLVFLTLFLFTPRRHIKWLFLLITVTLAGTAFLAVPKPSDDLSRYFWELEKLRLGGWDYFVRMIEENHSDWGSFPVIAVYFYLMSLLPSNNFLQAITIFLAYGGMFFTLWKAALRFEVEKKYILTAAFFLLSTYWYYDICSGIRNGLAFTMFGVCLYYELVERKNRPLCWLGYLLTFGMHSSVLILVAIRLCVFIAGKGKGRGLSIAMTAGLLLGSSALDFLTQWTEIPYLATIAGKVEAYGSGGFSLVRLFEYLLSASYAANFALFLVMIFLLAYHTNRLRDTPESWSAGGFTQFMKFTLFFMAGAAVTYSTVFIRLARWLIPQLGAILIMTGMQAVARQNEQKRIAPPPHSAIRVRRGDGGDAPIVNVLLVLFSVLHLGYLCFGSSLIWLKFS